MAPTDLRARFCPSCGAALADADGGGERKAATMLFADIVGSTALASGLDPEDVRARLERYFAAARAVLEAHGGTVRQSRPDAGISRLKKNLRGKARRRAKWRGGAVGRVSYDRDCARTLNSSANMPNRGSSRVFSRPLATRPHHAETTPRPELGSSRSRKDQ